MTCDPTSSSPNSDTRTRLVLLRSCGFSIVELSLVLVIIVVLSAIAMPRYASAIASYRAKAAATRIANDIAQVQSLARGTSTSRAIVFSLPANGYQISSLRDLETAANTYTVSLSAEPYRSTVSAINFGSDSQIIFDGYGNADRAGTITVGSGATSKTVSVDAVTGRTSIQ